MPASIKLIQRPHQLLKDGRIPIVIRVSENRRSQYIKTGYAVKESQFQEGMNNWVHHHPDSVLINAALEVKRSELMERVTLADMAGQSFEQGKVKDKLTIFKAIRQKMELHESENRAASYEKLESLLKNVKLAFNDKDTLLSDLSKEWVEKYTSYRISKKKHVNTIKKDLSLLSGVLLQVEDYPGKNYFKLANARFKAQETGKEKLTLEQVHTIENIKLFGRDDLARDIFLFSFYTHGMRFGDVAMLKLVSIKEDRLKYKMGKNAKLKEIILHDKLKVLIEKYKHNKPYLFPALLEEPKDAWVKHRLIGNALSPINLSLKRVAYISGIEINLTSHVARHSFAYLSLKRGVDRSILKDALNHSSYKTTETYLKSLSEDDINDAVKGLYD